MGQPWSSGLADDGALIPGGPPCRDQRGGDLTTSRVFVALVPAEIVARLPPAAPPGAPSVPELAWRAVLEHELALVLKEAPARQTWRIRAVVLNVTVTSIVLVLFFCENSIVLPPAPEKKFRITTTQ